MNKSIKVLMLFLGMLALALVYAYINWPRQPRIPLLPGSVPTSSIQKRAQLPARDADPQPVKVIPTDATLVSRNIFAPLFTPPQKTPTPEVEQTTQQPVDVQQAEVLPPPIARPLFLGMLRHQGRQRAFLSVDGEVYVVGPTERFGPDNSYQLLEISLNSLTVKHGTDADSFQIEAVQQPISVLSSSGVSYGAFPEVQKPKEDNVPLESGSLEKEVPIDNVIDE